MLHSLLTLILLWTGVYTTNDSFAQGTRQAIEHALTQKEKAVNQHNKSLFLALLYPANKMYQQEQKHWFDDAVQYIDKNSYQLQLKKIKAENTKTVTAWIAQIYTHKGKSYTLNYPLRFQHTPQGWKENDIAFNQYKEGSITVYYTKSNLKGQAQIALQTLQKAIPQFTKRYHWTPRKVEVKLYHEPEVFRQCVKPSLPTWAGGWHEANQAIKFIGGMIDDNSFAHGIVHELTHQMVSELTNDNAAYWLQEGAAMYYERHLMGDPVVTPRTSSTLSLSQLEKLNLESLPDEKASKYYASCYYLFQDLVKKQGEKRMAKLFSRLHAYPEIDLDSVQKMKVVNKRTKQAMESAF